MQGIQRKREANNSPKVIRPAEGLIGQISLLVLIEAVTFQAKKISDRSEREVWTEIEWRG
jgi:hypothetical protein